MAEKQALVIGDMPFLSYQTSVSDAVCNAGRFLKEGGAGGVKIEGGLEMIETVKKIIEAGIPVMGHIGLVPQSIHKFGKYSVQGKDKESQKYLLDSALALEKAGCFSIVLEAIPQELAKKISQSIKIPTIGIGAGPNCDGQVLVINDILGLYEEFKPKFARRYAELSKEIRKAVKNYFDDVKKGRIFGFVPTMGYLHEGHLSLIRLAKKKSDIVVVSIFVNPMQFGPKEDFKRYPRDLKRDTKLARKAGCDVLFIPSQKQIYPDRFSAHVNVEKLSDTLEGKFRSGHFKGVTTVVAKLFNIVQPA